MIGASLANAGELGRKVDMATVDMIVVGDWCSIKLRRVVHSTPKVSLDVDTGMETDLF